jgi:hypothetical protein
LILESRNFGAAALERMPSTYLGERRGEREGGKGGREEEEGRTSRNEART